MYNPLGNDFIAVKIKETTKFFVYNSSIAGSYNVDRAKQLAENGSGLNRHINLNMKN
jgi:hypothetical protein